MNRDSLTPITDYLRVKRTIQDLCSQFELPPRTVYRRLRSLRGVGVDIVSRKIEGKMYYQVI